MKGMTIYYGARKTRIVSAMIGVSATISTGKDWIGSVHRRTYVDMERTCMALSQNIGVIASIEDLEKAGF
jgi:hypothetical protein